MELVSSVCRCCSSAELLPECCSVCCFFFCRTHVKNHVCLSVPDLLSNPLQDREAVASLASLFVRKVLPEMAASGKLRRLNCESQQLQCLGRVVQGKAFLSSLGWVSDGPTHLVLDGRALDLQKSLKMQMQHFARLMPASASAVAQKIRFLVVLDFEANCMKDVRIKPQEIIEFPMVLLDLQSLKICGEFHKYVRPVVHPKLTDFCTELTGITQDMVDSGVSMQQAFEEAEHWLEGHGLIDKNSGKKLIPFVFVTCGDWDLKTALSENWKLAWENRRKLPKYWDEWINIKVSFSSQYPKLKGGGSMVGMLNALQLELIGRHHSGIDDTRNIARICVKMANDGHLFKTTCWRVK